MKLTPQLEEFLTKQFIFYCKRMEVDLPMLLYRDEELGGMVNSYKEFKSLKDGVLGESWHRNDTELDYDIVYINVDGSDYLAQLIDTIVHELVHLKYPKARHGMGFQKRINTIMMESM